MFAPLNDRRRHIDHVHLFSYLALNGKLNGENSFIVVPVSARRDCWDVAFKVYPVMRQIKFSKCVNLQMYALFAVKISYLLNG